MKHRIVSLPELEQMSSEWDALIDRSHERQPTNKVSVLANYLRTFESSSEFFAVLVYDESQKLIAGLPVLKRRMGVIRVASLPNNPWLTCGELFADPQTRESECAHHLMLGLQEAGIDLVWFDWIAIESNRWRALADQLSGAGQLARTNPQFHVGAIELDRDFDSYFARVSKGHRKKMRSRTKKLKSMGDLTLEYLDVFSTHSELEESLRQVFKVEHTGWKGKSATSVLSNLSIFEFYRRTAIALSNLDALRLSVLKLNGRAIAFEYGYVGARIYHSLKVGYDQRHAEFSPGQLLTLELLRHFHGTREVDVFDTLGSLSDASEKWITRSVLRGRMMASLSFRGRLFLRGHGVATKLADRVRGAKPPLAEPRLIRDPIADCRPETVGGVEPNSSVSPEVFSGASEAPLTKA